MPRASQIAKAERLNWARSLLRQGSISNAVQKLTRRYSISLRQAYRYVQEAQHLQRPVLVGDTKIAFTVKLSRKLAHRIRQQARRSGCSVSELVSRALMALLARRRGRG